MTHKDGTDPCEFLEVLTDQEVEWLLGESLSCPEDVLDHLGVCLACGARVGGILEAAKVRAAPQGTFLQRFVEALTALGKEGRPGESVALTPRGRFLGGAVTVELLA